MPIQCQVSECSASTVPGVGYVEPGERVWCDPCLFTQFHTSGPLTPAPPHSGAGREGEGEEGGGGGGDKVEGGGG